MLCGFGFAGSSRVGLFPQLLATLLLLSQPNVAPGLLLGASVLPHGDFAWLPSLLAAGSVNRTVAERVHAGARAAAAQLRAAAPDVVLVVAPHGAALMIEYLDSRAAINVNQQFLIIQNAASA